MIRRFAWRILPAFLLACAASIVPAQGGKTQAATPSAVRQALAFVPASAKIAYFTDWALIKQYTGASTLSSASPRSAKEQFVNSLSKDQAATTEFGVDYFFQMDSLWAFDLLDLQWQAEAETTATPVSVLRFNDSFNFAPVLAHFAQRKYARTVYRGITLYSHPMDVTQKWFTQGPLSVLNAAYLPKSHIVVFSSAIVSVKAALDAYLGRAPSLADNAAIQSMTGALGVVAAAIFEPERGACEPFAVAGNAAAADYFARLRKQVHRFDAFAIGYRDEERHPLGIADLHFAAPAEAAADLRVRRMLAVTGTSVVTRMPYSKAVFTLLGASLAGSDIVFRLRPFKDHPEQLFNMVNERDVLFALCP